jgi:sortase A
MLGLYLGARISENVLSRAEIHRFNDQRSSSQQARSNFELSTRSPDFGLWSKKRIRGYEQALSAHFPPAVAVLRIPRIDLEVPVLATAGDLSLNRAIGLIAGTSRPGEDGNIGIAGHRDGFFRRLKDAEVGDSIELTTPTEVYPYVIDRIVVVQPNDVSVLARRPTSSVTLVTCYPFYFVGSAPLRYIVQATLVTKDTRTIE